MSGRSTPASGEDGEPKKKKIRKGTTSCWECKRRKTRCQFRSPSDEVCIGCQRRETACLSQEHPEHPPQGATRSIVRIEERLERLEGLLEKVIENGVSTPKTQQRRNSYSSQSQTATDGISDYNLLTPYSVHTPNPDTAPMLYNAVINDSNTTVSTPSAHTSNPSPPTSQSNLKSICRKLYDLLPSQRDADMILSFGGTASYLQFFTRSHSDIFSGNIRSASSLSAIPGPSSHPVLFVRTLLYLVIGIQQLYRSKFDLTQLTLGQSPWDALTQYLEAASNFIANNDRYLDSLEAMECIMLEGYYHMNSGNLRKAWWLFRRGIGLGQLMGLHRGKTNAKVLEPHNAADVSFMWYRVIYADRHLALLLGLPCNITHNNVFASEELLKEETPIGRLERVHCVISGRIIERNENITDDGFAITQNIDSYIQKAAKTMPPKWWLLSNITEDGQFKELEDLMRIIVQIMHFNLLVLLHLPYMIKVSPERRFDYSKIACINNSRELLARYTRLKSFNKVTFCSRSIDFSAFTGSLTLLLAHLESHRNNNHGMDQFLAHQRDSDRLMVEQVINLILQETRLNNDVLAQQTAAILKCLLAIEAEASGDHASNTSEEFKNDRGLRLTIPYFGTVNISRNGIVKSAGTELPKEDSRTTTFVTAGNLSNTLSMVSEQSDTRLKGPNALISPSATLGPESQHNDFQQSDVDQAFWEGIPTPSAVTLQTEFYPNMEHYPVGLNAEVQDWALQGVDRAFFENLLREGF